MMKYIWLDQVEQRPSEKMLNQEIVILIFVTDITTMLGSIWFQT